MSLVGRIQTSLGINGNTRFKIPGSEFPGTRVLGNFAKKMFFHKAVLNVVTPFPKGATLILSDGEHLNDSRNFPLGIKGLWRIEPDRTYETVTALTLSLNGDGGSGYAELIILAEELER